MARGHHDVVGLPGAGPGNWGVVTEVATLPLTLTILDGNRLDDRSDWADDLYL